MGNPINAWYFRMKPRSILRTIEWFPYFAMLEGQNWDLVDPQNVSISTHRGVLITRRKYLLSAHSDEISLGYDDFMSGRFDVKDIESQARNDKASFEFYGFGYVDDSNIVRVTEFGRLIAENRMSGEQLLKQLLKIQFPSPRSGQLISGKCIFPLEIFLETITKFDTLSRTEVAFLFGCIDIDETYKVENAINEFRLEFSKLSENQKTKHVGKLFGIIFNKTFPNNNNQPDSYLDYADAFIRAVSYTGLFLTKGRSHHLRVYIPEHAKTKVKLLSEKFVFSENTNSNITKFMTLFGDPYNVQLPWDNPIDRKIIVESKLDNYKKILQNTRPPEDSIFKEVKSIELLIEKADYKALLIADETLSTNLLNENERVYIEILSKTRIARDEIIEKFVEIREGSEELAALWLEVNTWRSLVAMTGDHRVKRNFKLEDDLTPKSFAPGSGNTPDMELYVNGYILIPEVSLMSGVRQWEHEGSSVIDHVLKFIESSPDKKVFGLFISKTMNIRSKWQFFILNKESWIGKNVPVIPLTIDQYINIISFVYDNEINIHDFSKLIVSMHTTALTSKDYQAWESGFSQIIDEWKSNVCV